MQNAERFDVYTVKQRFHAYLTIINIAVYRHESVTQTRFANDLTVYVIFYFINRRTPCVRYIRAIN